MGKEKKLRATVLAAPTEAKGTLLGGKQRAASAHKKGATPAATASGSSHEPPSSSLAWANVAIHCLMNQSVPFARAIEMLEEVAKGLLAEEAEMKYSAEGGAAAAKAKGKKDNKAAATPGEDDPEYSEPEGSGGGKSQNSNAPQKKKEPDDGDGDDSNGSVYTKHASQFLLLASQLCAASGTPSMAATLAKSAVNTSTSPETLSALAWASIRLSLIVRETVLQTPLHNAASELAQAATRRYHQIQRAPSCTALSDLARNSWIYAVTGDGKQATELAEYVIRRDRTRLDLLVLLALLHSSGGRYDYSLNVLQHCHQLHPYHVTAGLLTTALKHASGDLQSVDDVEQELMISLARVQAVHAYATGNSNLSPSSQADISLIGHGEVDWSDTHALLVRCASYYALVADVALLLKSTSVAELAIDLGLELIRINPIEALAPQHSSLLVARGQLWLQRVRAIQKLRRKYSDTAFAGTGTNTDPAAGATATTLTPGTAYVGASKTSSELARLTSDTALQDLEGTLGRAVELCPYNADAYRSLGEMWFAAADVLGVSVSEKQARLSKAAFELQTSIRCDMRRWEAYDGLGRVREEQGALDISIDLLQCAAQLSNTAPLLPYKRFIFLCP